MLVSKDTTQNTKNQFYNYFIVPKGDFSLYNIITEYGSTLEIENIKQFPKLFETFYKVIEPFSRFSIYVLTDDFLGNWEYYNIIQTILLKDVEEYFDKTMIKSLRGLSFSPNEIVVSFKN